MSREQQSDVDSMSPVSLTTEITMDIDRLSLTSTSGASQQYGRSFTEGDDIVAYVYKPAEKRTHEVENCVCAHNEHRLQEVFILSVHELLIAGRIGIGCRDPINTHEPLMTTQLHATTASLPDHPRLFSPRGESK